LPPAHAVDSPAGGARRRPALTPGIEAEIVQRLAVPRCTRGRRRSISPHLWWPILGGVLTQWSVPLRELTMPTNAVGATSGDSSESGGVVLVGPAARFRASGVGISLATSLAGRLPCAARLSACPRRDADRADGSRTSSSLGNSDGSNIPGFIPVARQTAVRPGPRWSSPTGAHTDHTGTGRCAAWSER
jgi:hypothetical protein